MAVPPLSFAPDFAGPDQSETHPGYHERDIMSIAASPKSGRLRGVAPIRCCAECRSGPPPILVLLFLPPLPVQLIAFFPSRADPALSWFCDFLGLVYSSRGRWNYSPGRGVVNPVAGTVSRPTVDLPTARNVAQLGYLGFAKPVDGTTTSPWRRAVL